MYLHFSQNKNKNYAQTFDLFLKSHTKVILAWHTYIFVILMKLYKGYWGENIGHKKTRQAVISLNVSLCVLPTRFELISMVPETIILSIELREQ